MNNLATITNAKVPVLLIAFNRPELTQQILQQIAGYAPPRLYVAIDGEREDNLNDTTNVSQVKQLIAAWEEEHPHIIVNKLYREKNLGCGIAPYQSISWLFENEQMGIILEDDCLPLQSFFTFCETMLHKYADDKRIFEITGTNLQNGKQRGRGSYYFSKYGSVWGWATWSRAWEKYSYEMNGIEDFINTNQLAAIFNDKAEIDYWTKAFLYASKLGSWWDYQWLYTIWRNNGICIVPNSNLIKNNGFNTAGTHFNSEPKWYTKLGSNRKDIVTIVHPADVEIDKQADDFLFKEVYKQTFFSKLTGFVGRIKTNLKKN